MSFEVTDPKAEYSSGTMKIYATVKFQTTMTEVNHVWQVGGSVMGGMPMKHEFQSGNLKSKGKLRLTENVPSNGTSGNVGSPVIAPSPSISCGFRNTVMYVCFIIMIAGLISS